MQTTGVCQVGTSSPGSQRCLHSCMRAVVRPCCCMYCCTDLTLTRQDNSVRLPSATPALLALASSSRSQVPMWAARAAARLTWARPSVSVRWRPLLAVAIVTHLVTRSLARLRRERLVRSSPRRLVLQLTPRAGVSVAGAFTSPLPPSGTQRARAMVPERTFPSSALRAKQASPESPHELDIASIPPATKHPVMSFYRDDGAPRRRPGEGEPQCPCC